MSELFLTSNISDVAQDIAGKLDTSGIRLAFIYTAAELYPDGPFPDWNQENRQTLVDMGFQVTNYTITGKNAVELRKDLSQFDVIYVSGGNTYYLLQQAQLTGFIEIIRDLVVTQNTIYIGTSAGSVVAGPNISPIGDLDDKSEASQLNGFLGFNLVNFCILPHWGSEDFSGVYQSACAQAYIPNQVPLLFLTNFQYVHLKDNHLEIINVI